MKHQVLSAYVLKVLFPANIIPLWPWTLIFWPQNLMHLN